MRAGREEEEKGRSKGRTEEDARASTDKNREDGEEEEPGRQRAGVRQGDPVPYPDLPVAADQVGVRAEQVSERKGRRCFIVSPFCHLFFKMWSEMGEDNCIRDIAPVTTLNREGSGLDWGMLGCFDSGLSPDCVTAAVFLLLLQRLPKTQVGETV